MARFGHKSMTGTEGIIDIERPGEYKWQVSGDVSGAKEEVKRSREVGRNKKAHYQHMCTIPNVIAVELLTKHGIDIMSPEFMSDEAAKTRFKYILKTEYPDLLVMT